MKSLQIFDKEVVNKLDSLAGLLAGTKKLMGNIGKKAVAEMRKNFEFESGPNAEKWKPLSSYTLMARRTKPGGYKYGDDILRDTGKLYNLKHVVTGNTTVEVGTNMPYGKRHDVGGYKIPKREWLYLNPASEDKLIQEMHNHFYG